MVWQMAVRDPHLLRLGHFLRHLEGAEESARLGLDIEENLERVEEDFLLEPWKEGLTIVKVEHPAGGVKPFVLVSTISSNAHKDCPIFEAARISKGNMAKERILDEKKGSGIPGLSETGDGSFSTSAGFKPWEEWEKYGRDLGELESIFKWKIPKQRKQVRQGKSKAPKDTNKRAEVNDTKTNAERKSHQKKEDISENIKKVLSSCGKSRKNIIAGKMPSAGHGSEAPRWRGPREEASQVAQKRRVKRPVDKTCSVVRGGWGSWLKEVKGQNGWPNIEAGGVLLGGGSDEDEEEDEAGISVQCELGKVVFFESLKVLTPKSVKDKFDLDYEPENLLSIPPEGSKKKAKKVSFKKLQDGQRYKVVEDERNKIPNQKQNSLNAAVLSEAIYEDNPTEYLQKTRQPHTIAKVCGISKHSDQKVMLAVVEVKRTKTLYVVYRGTTNAADVKADLSIEHAKKKGMEGTFHKGFSSRSEVIPVKYILQCANQNQCTTVVTCGHSLGGAVSSIVAIDLMRDLETSDRLSSSDMMVYNITFGVPFWGDKAVLQFCRERNMTQNILNFANYNDIVPGLLAR